MKKVLILFAALLVSIYSVNAQTREDELVKTRAREKVAQMLSYISRMADKQKPRSTRTYYRKKALNLYIGAGGDYTIHGVYYDPVKMQVSSLRTGRIKEIPVSQYFSNLINLNYTKVSITYTEVVDMKVSDLQQIDENLYQCTVQYVQIFRGYRDGFSTVDRTTKRVVCFVKKDQTIDGDEYVILLGDTHCDQTEPLDD